MALSIVIVICLILLITVSIILLPRMYKEKNIEKIMSERKIYFR